jgi:hypothetical protein
MKQCVICGKDFEPKVHPGAKKQKCCCKECSNINNRKLVDKYQMTHKKEIAEQAKRRRKPVICKICNKPITRNESGRFPRIHESCIIADCIETMKNHKKLNDLQRSRVYGKGITIAEIKELMREEKEK